jgi:hypothetical protein
MSTCLAAALVISVKTASVHVSHILSKLDAPNRLERPPSLTASSRRRQTGTMAADDPWAPRAERFVDTHYATLRGRVRIHVIGSHLREHLPPPPARLAPGQPARSLPAAEPALPPRRPARHRPVATAGRARG